MWNLTLDADNHSQICKNGIDGNNNLLRSKAFNVAAEVRWLLDVEMFEIERWSGMLQQH